MRVPGKTNILTNVECDGELKKGLLSIATVFPTQDPQFCSILEIYGGDEEALELHIACQIEFAKKNASGTMCCMVFFNERLGVETVEERFNRIGITKLDWGLSGLKCTKQFMYRKDINQ